MEEKKIHITGSDVNHIINVLRMRQGETILISAGDNLEYTCLVSEMEAEEVIADISYVQEVGMELPSKIYLFQGLPKSDKMEMIIQKAVELGVYEVIPAMHRSIWLRMRTLIFRMMTKGKMQSFLKKHFMRKNQKFGEGV